MQLRRDIAAGAVDTAVFEIMSDRRFRNVAHPQRMRYYLTPQWHKLGVEHIPVAKMTSACKVQIDYCALWQPVIRDADFDMFLPDDYMLNVATLAVLDLVRTTAQEAGIPLRFVVLERFNDAVDISTPQDVEHTFLPGNLHPNAYANELFVQRLGPLISDLAHTIARGGAS